MLYKNLIIKFQIQMYDEKVQYYSLNMINLKKFLKIKKINLLSKIHKKFKNWIWLSNSLLIVQETSVFQ